MATIINASTSGGLIQTADTSGVLNLQTAGVTAMQIDASQNVTFTNPISASGMTALGTITTTSGNSVSLTGLNLTGYKQIQCQFNNTAQTSSSANSSLQLNANSFITGTTSAKTYYGTLLIDLTTGYFTFTGGSSNSAQGGVVTVSASGLTTSSTSITFTLNSTATFTGGSILVYGVK